MYLRAQIIAKNIIITERFTLCWENKRINPLNTKRRPLYLKAQSVPRSKHFSSRLWNQSVYAV